MPRLPLPAFLLNALIGASLLLLTACTSAVGKADRAFEARDLRRAVAAYESFLAASPATKPAAMPAGKGRERALFRLALLYDSPDSPIHDSRRARELFEQLVEEAPGHPYTSLLGRSFYLEVQLKEAREEVEGQEVRCRALASALEESRQQTRQLHADLDLSREALASRERETRRLHGQLQQLLSEVATNRERAERLKEALELLKRIDLASTTDQTGTPK
jgi:hypothetical protein